MTEPDITPDTRPRCGARTGISTVCGLERGHESPYHEDRDEDSGGRISWPVEPAPDSSDARPTALQAAADWPEAAQAADDLERTHPHWGVAVGFYEGARWANERTAQALQEARDRAGWWKARSEKHAQELDEARAEAATLRGRVDELERERDSWMSRSILNSDGWDRTQMEAATLRDENERLRMLVAGAVRLAAEQLDLRYPNDPEPVAQLELRALAAVVEAGRMLTPTTGMASTFQRLRPVPPLEGSNRRQ